MVNICYGQNEPTRTKKIIKEIAKNNYIAATPDGFINLESLSRPKLKQQTTKQPKKQPKHQRLGTQKNNRMSK